MSTVSKYFCDGPKTDQDRFLLNELNKTKSRDCIAYHDSSNSNMDSDQWRSEGGQGGQGGQLPPGAARRGAPKSCQGIF